MSNYKVEFVSLDKTNQSVINPARGWYEIYNFAIEEKIDFDELIWSLRADESLALLLIDIGTFKNEAISESAIANLENILSFFIKNKKDIILRITYDRLGRAKTREPSFFSIVLRHMSQLGKIIKKYSDGIFTCQGLFVGNWGEMHGSDYLSGECIKKMYDSLFDAMEGKVRLSVRKPAQWRCVFEREVKKSNSLSDRFINFFRDENEKKCILGLFDDGIFGSDTNLGTFGVTKRSDAKWNDTWRVCDELDFVDNLCNVVPCGGEVVWSEYSAHLSAEDFVIRLRKMHVTYLNCAHDEKILNKWKNMQYNGVNLYDYIGTHMGYSFKIIKLKSKIRREKLLIDVGIINEGFAPLYDKSIISVGVITTDGNFFDKKNIDNNMECEKLYDFQFELPLCNGDLFIKMQRQSDGFQIAFTNISYEDESAFGAKFGKIISQ